MTYQEWKNAHAFRLPASAIETLDRLMVGKPQRMALAGHPAIVAAHEHPDFPSYQWSRLELDWIDARDRQWQALIDAAKGAA